MQNIKELRHKTGLSQKEFAKKYNLSFRTLQQWEQGISKPLDSLIMLIKNDIEGDSNLRKKFNNNSNRYDVRIYNLFKYALTNFDCAKIIRKSIKDENEEMINLIGYHLEQAIELSIKFTLEMNGVEYPNTHRIEDLIRIANKNDVDLHINEYIKEHDALLSSWEANTIYIIGYLIELEKIDRALKELESYFLNLIDIYNKL